MLPPRPSSPEPGQVAEFRRSSGADGRERRRSASPRRPPSPPRSARPPSPPRARPPPPGPGGIRRGAERWDSTTGRYDRPVVYDRYARDARDSRERDERFARRGSSPSSARGSVSRGGTPSRNQAREIPREPVFKGLDGLTQYLARTVMAKAKVEQASRALQRIKEFQPDASTLADAEGALSAAEAALKTECELLQDSFVSLLQQALAVPGVSTGDASGLHVDELRSRVARIEQRAAQHGPGLTEEEIKAFVKASTPAATSPTTPALSEDDIRGIVRKEGISEDRVRELARSSATGLNEEQVRKVVQENAPTEDRVREIVLANATGLNEEQVRTVIKKNVPSGLSDEHIKALIRLNAPTAEQVQDIVKSSIPAAVSAQPAPAATPAAKEAPPPPPSTAAADPPKPATGVKPEDGAKPGAERTQIKLRALLKEVLERVEAVESNLDERYERLQSDVDEQRFDLTQAVGRYELAAARKAAALSAPDAPANAVTAAAPAPAVTSAAQNSTTSGASSGELAALKAEMGAMRSQMAAMGGELSSLRSQVASLKAQPPAPSSAAPKPAPAALGPEFDARMNQWKAAILKDIEDWIHSKMPGIVAPILEDMKGKVLAQMLVEARAGGMGGMGGVGAGAGVPAPMGRGYQGAGYQQFPHR